MQEFIDTLINGPARYTQAHDFSPTLSLLVVVGVLLIELGILYSVIVVFTKIIRHRHTLFSFTLRRLGVGIQTTKYVFLQLTFPTDVTKTAYATEQLHILIRDLAKYDKFWDRLAGRKHPYSLELVATHNNGIRYIIRIPAEEAGTVKRTLLSFLPDLKIETVDDYLLGIIEPECDLAEMNLSYDFILPLADHKKLNRHDPIAYLTGHMRSLLVDELMAFQIVAVPMLTDTHPNEMRHIRDVQRLITLNEELTTKLTTLRIDIPYLLYRVLFAPFRLILICGKTAFSIVSVLLTHTSKRNTNTQPIKNVYERELKKAAKAKLNQHLYEVSIRLLVISPDSERRRNRLNALRSSLNTFTTSSQSLVSRKRTLFASSSQRFDRFRNRELSPHIVSQQTILSSSELSDLYHFPNTDLTKTEGLVKSRSRELAAPLSIKQTDTKLDVIVGENKFGGEVIDVGMTLKQRQRHTYIIGKTGTGKTTLLKNSIYQDMLNDKGLAVLDPHGDMFRELLRIVPQKRRKDVVVFDPSDREYPIGLNIFDPGIEFANEDDRHEWITSAVLSIFTKLADEKQWGPRMEHILRSTTLTALHTPKPNLYTLQRLLTDKNYQKEVAKTLQDPILKQFWEKEFKMMGNMQMSAATAPLTHRLGHFITSKMSRHILLQEESSVRIADIMNEGKILLVNLSKGDIGEDQSKFFGTILTTLIWMAAYQRTKIPEEKRRDFFVYVDEFQNFATPQFSAITSEGRKFHISLIVSHQNIAQIEDKDLVKIIAGNAATIICLKANPEDESFILPYMEPEVKGGDIVNLAPYHFYMKVSSDESEDAFSGQTVQLDVEGADLVGQEILTYSRKMYATPKKEVEAHLLALLDTKKSVQIRKSRKTQSKMYGL